MCLSMGSKDNMTCTILRFPAQKTGEGGGVISRRQKRDTSTVETAVPAATVIETSNAKEDIMLEDPETTPQ